MCDTTLETAVREALNQIHHSRQCYNTTLGDLGGLQVRVCVCDREVRIAERFAAALREAAVGENTYPTTRECLEAALCELRGEGGA